LRSIRSKHLPLMCIEQNSWWDRWPNGKWIKDHCNVINYCRGLDQTNQITGAIDNVVLHKQDRMLQVPRRPRKGNLENGNAYMIELLQNIGCRQQRFTHRFKIRHFKPERKASMLSYSTSKRSLISWTDIEQLEIDKK
jgi:hypothetical protein